MPSLLPGVWDSCISTLWGRNPLAQPQTWRARIVIFFPRHAQNVSEMGGPNISWAVAGWMALDFTVVGEANWNNWKSSIMDYLYVFNHPLFFFFIRF
jgi:hypothetical protein